MPNLNQTGPFGQEPLTGKRRSHCANTATVQTAPAEIKTEDKKEVLYGVGRGGRPYGGGRGYCHGGPNRKGNEKIYQ